MKSCVLLLIFLIISQSSWATTKKCDSLFSPSTEELERDAAVEHVLNKVKKNSFETFRPLQDYVDYFGEKFLKRLKSLGPDQHWLELGAGSGRAIDYYIQKIKKGSNLPFITAVNAVEPKNFLVDLNEMAKKNPKLKHRVGFFEKTNIEEIAPVDVVTDVLGVLSYTMEFDLVFRNLSKIMKPKARLYTRMMVPEILEADGTPISFGDFFSKYVKGFKLVEDPKPFSQVANMEIVRAKRAKIMFPTLELVELENGIGHDRRTFRIVASP